MVDFEVHLHANQSCCSFFLSRSWRAVQGVSGFVWRGSSCLLTRVLLCFNNVSPRCISTWDSSAGVHAGLALTDLGLAQEDQNQTPVLFLLLLPQTTCTRKHMHAHMHICTDVEPPSAPAAPCLAPTCLPPSFPHPAPHPLTYYSVYAVALTPKLQPQPFPLLPVVSCLPLGFQRVPPVQSAWRACRFQWCCRLGRFTGQVWLGPELSADSSYTLHHHHRTLSSGGGSYQVATPLPLSSRAFPVGRTRSRTGSVSDGQPYFFSFCFWVGLFFSSCVRAQ